MSFSDQIRAHTKKAKARSNRLVKKILINTSSAIIMRTPVGSALTTGVKGYLGGTARGAWQPSFGSPATEDITTIDENGQATISAVDSFVGNSPAGTIFYLTNNVNYISFLEDGTSAQAPAGMVKVTVAEINAIIRDAANE